MRLPCVCTAQTTKSKQMKQNTKPNKTAPLLYLEIAALNAAKQIKDDEPLTAELSERLHYVAVVLLDLVKIDGITAYLIDELTFDIAEAVACQNCVEISSSTTTVAETLANIYNRIEHGNIEVLPKLQRLVFELRHIAKCAAKLSRSRL